MVTLYFYYSPSIQPVPSNSTTHFPFLTYFKYSRLEILFEAKVNFSSIFKFDNPVMTLILLQDKLSTLNFVNVCKPSILSSEFEDKLSSISSLNLSIP